MASDDSFCLRIECGSAGAALARTLILSTSAADTVLTIKKQIFALESTFAISRQSMHLTPAASGQPLADACTLGSLGIVENGAVLYMMLAAMGSMQFLRSFDAHTSAAAVSSHSAAASTTAASVAGKISSRPAAFQNPTASLVDAVRGRILIADRDNGRVLALHSTTLKLVWEQCGGEGEPADNDMGSWRPTALALSADGSSLFVADQLRHRLVTLRADTGAFVAAAGSYGADIGQLYAPGGLAVGGGLLWVADSGNHRVFGLHIDQAADKTVASAAQSASASASALATSGGAAHLPARWRIARHLGVTSVSGIAQTHLDEPRGLAVDEVHDRLYVCDARNHRVQVLHASTGIVLCSIPPGAGGVAGTGAGQLDCPVDVCVSHSMSDVARRTFVYVAEAGRNHRVSVFDAASLDFVGWCGSRDSAASKAAAATPATLEDVFGVCVDATACEVLVTQRIPSRVSVFRAL